MPSSSLIADPWVHDILASLKPKTALDIGIGCGRFGFLFREKCEPRNRPDFFHPQNWQCSLEGIEAFEPYIGDMQRIIYNKIYFGDAYDIVPSIQHTYDIIHLGDVLEHFAKPRGLKLVRECFARANLGVIIIMPYYPEDQSIVFGNEYERHKDRYLISDFNDYPHRIGRIIWEKFFPSRLLIYLSAKPVIIKRLGPTSGGGISFRKRINEWWIPSIKGILRHQLLVRQFLKFRHHAITCVKKGKL